MTKAEARKMIELCTDVITKPESKDDEVKTYVSKSYVLSVLEMIDNPEYKSSSNDKSDSDIIPPNTYPFGWPKVYCDYLNVHNNFGHGPTDVYGNPVAYCSTIKYPTGQYVEEFTTAGSINNK